MSGAMALTGRRNGAPLQAPPAVEAFLGNLQRDVGDRLGLDVAPLLGERAALAGLVRQGDVSCGGAARLLPVADGWCAVSLARPDDIELLPAWLNVAADDDNPWLLVAAALRTRSTGPIVEQATLLGIPCAAVGGVQPERPAVIRRHLGHRRAIGVEGALVVDLSSLWAGPLCANLLQLAGARVVKVESTRRPDGARRGPTPFYDLLHGGQEAVAFDFTTADGRASLRRLVERADVVIESSRPRAMAQLGIDPVEVTSTGRFRCWISVTGYGRASPLADRVAFGDDAAASVGLVGWDGDGPVFCGDAIADPLAGIVAAGAVLEALTESGQWLLDVSLSACAAAALGGHTAHTPWPVAIDARAPIARTPGGKAPDIGADTDAVMAEVVVRPFRR